MEDFLQSRDMSGVTNCPSFVILFVFDDELIMSIQHVTTIFKVKIWNVVQFVICFKCLLKGICVQVTLIHKMVWAVSQFLGQRLDHF